MAGARIPVFLLDVSGLDYEDRLTASSLQGLANRDGPRLFLDHGSYDDPGSRRTNSVQMTEENWRVKYRQFLSRNDLDNLDEYQKSHPMAVTVLRDLLSAIRAFPGRAKGIVIYDPALVESVNLALMLAGLSDLLVSHPDRASGVREATGLPVVEDLRGRFQSRVDLSRWAFTQLFHECRPGQVACVEPEWRRSEFADYIVQNRLFTYSLASFSKGGLRTLGQKLLLLLIAGPFGVRNFLFSLRLDTLVRRLAVKLLGSGAPEVRLAIRIQRAVAADPYPTIFGWHTQRDDEFAFMMLLSANGLRLVPSFLAGNYSFHSRLPKVVPFRQRYVEPGSVKLEQDKVYLTFVLSDGDQLALMNTAEVGNWRRPERGSVPFNYEVQPLLVELAPALLGSLYRTLTPNDLLVAGPSGAGYVIPPLVPRFPAYLRHTAATCDAADIRVITQYNADPARRVVRELGRAGGNLLGFLAGYFHLGRTPRYLAAGRPFVACAWPHLDQIALDTDKVLEGIRALVDAPGPYPRFLACHLFAYCTTVSDVSAFVRSLDPDRVRVVRADEFLIAAKIHLEGKER
ncbi:MAG: GxGYxYP family putative glycoside hydrolase [Spirochaetes bacterium]|nr:GxGYxYP family putative glycoside hydrolase [Spirochaetota bacterium]